MTNRALSQSPLVGTLCLIGFLSPAARAQPQVPATRITIDLRNAQPPANWPVAVTGVAIAGRPVPFGRPITVSGKWLAQTVVTLRNISPKAVIQVGVVLTFPESGDGSHERPYEAAWSTLGRVPRVVYIDRNGVYHPPFGAQPAPLRVPPGGSIRLSFSRDGDAVQTKLADMRVPLTKATLSFTTVYFADDARWSAGEYYLAPHPAPGSWTRVTKEEFFHGAGSARQH